MGGGGGGGTRPRYLIVCLWRRLLASRQCSFRPSVGPNVFWLCQRSPWMTCPVRLLQARLSRRRAVARAVDQVHPDAHSESMLGLPLGGGGDDNYICTHNVRDKPAFYQSSPSVLGLVRHVSKAVTKNRKQSQNTHTHIHKRPHRYPRRRGSARGPPPPPLHNPPQVPRAISCQPQMGLEGTSPGAKWGQVSVARSRPRAVHNATLPYSGTPTPHQCTRPSGTAAGYPPNGVI